MGLQVFGRGKAGEIILHDQRPDGTAILLVCQPFGPSGNVAEDVGVGFASSTDGGIFPMLDEADVAKRKFRLHIDTSRMPGGPMRFGMASFTRRALQAADEGYREMELTPENAEEWGWQGSAAPPPLVPSYPAPASTPPRRPRRGSQDAPTMSQTDVPDDE